MDHALYALALCGAAAGMLLGLLGVGGNFVMVPVLRRYTDLAMQCVVVATLLAVIALVSTTGVASSAAAGTLELGSGDAVFRLRAGQLVAACFGGPLLQKGFALVSVMVAIGMTAKAGN